MAISAEEFELIRRFVHDQSGILVNPGKEYLVENRLTPILVQCNCDNFLQLYQKLQKPDETTLRTKVIDAMTTNETLWFRDDSFYAALSGHLIPWLVSRGKQGPVRIWSAACSTGQEPYSVAMLIEEERAKRGALAAPSGNFQIMATDISPSAIFIASSGRYSQLAISRGMKENFLSRYFVKNGLAYEIAPGIRQMVKFQQFNLKDSFTALGTFDFVLCRNVLIYFADDLKRDIYQKIFRAMQREGALVIGASESPRGYSSDYKQLLLGGAAVFRPHTAPDTL